MKKKNRQTKEQKRVSRLIENNSSEDYDAKREALSGALKDLYKRQDASIVVARC